MSIPGEPPVSGVSNPSLSRRAVTVLVLGVLAVGLSVLVVGVVPAIAGVVLYALTPRRDPRSRAFAVWGVRLSVLGGVLSLVMAGFVGWGVRTLVERLGPGSAFTEWEGVRAPDLTVTTHDGKVLKLSELRGKRVVLDFWATWCPPCVREIPHFSRLHRETSRDELEILGISSESAEDIAAFVRKNDIPYPMGGAEERVPPYSDVTAIPTTFFIDRQGVIQSVTVGYKDYATLRAHALAGDWEGEPRESGPPPAAGLREAARGRTLAQAWTVTVEGAKTLAVGEWGRGAPEVMVPVAGMRLGRWSADGSALGFVAVPADVALLEMGRRGPDGGVACLGHEAWGSEVVVFTAEGARRWAYEAPSGVNGAHWGDLNGDGADEMVVGLNGGGGLRVLSADGKELWKDTRIGNVWSQAIVPADGVEPGRVFATEAGGTVRIYDPTGKLLRSFRPDGKYCAAMTARRMGRTGPIQVLGVANPRRYVATTEEGSVVWSTPAAARAERWNVPPFAAGDMDGDGTEEWALLEAEAGMALVTPAGERLASLASAGDADDWEILPGPGGAGRLVTLKGGVVTAYRLE